MSIIDKKKTKRAPSKTPTKTPSKTSSKTFRISKKKLFFTYSQTNVTPRECFKQLSLKLHRWIIQDYVITQEDHKEGESANVGKHLHCYIELHKKCDIKNPEFLHLLDTTGATVKGNYQQVKKDTDVIQYILKDVDIKDINDNSIISKNIRDRICDIKGFEDDVHKSIIRLARKGEIDSALEMMEQHFPKEFMRSHMNIEKSLRALYLKNQGLVTRFDISNFMIPNELRDFLDSHQKNNFNKTIVLIGESNTGKTAFTKAWLKAIGKNYMYITHLEGLKKLEAKHDFIVFDDCQGLLGISREQVIAIVDIENENDLRILYQSQSIPQDVGRVIIANNKNRIFTEEMWRDPAIERRVSIFIIKEGISFIPRVPPTNYENAVRIEGKDPVKTGNINHEKTGKKHENDPEKGGE